jgi:predicted acetyltransferase
VTADPHRPVVPTVRTITADEVDRYYDLDSAAFGVLNEPTFLAAKRTIVDPDRFYLAEFDGEAVGAAGSFPFDLTLPGGSTVPVCGVSDVGVLPTHRRRGVLRALLTRQLDDAAAAGERAAVLSASEATIYGRFGFGTATRWRRVEVPTARARFRADAPVSGGRLRLVARDRAAGVLAEVYRRSVGVGALSRTEAWWQVVLGDAELFIGGHRLHHVMVHEDTYGTTDAYAIYRIVEMWGDTGPAHHLVVTEIMGVDPAAELAVWRGLLDHDLVAELSAYLPADHLLFDVLDDPRALSAGGERDFLWLRPLDVEALLGARTYATDGRLVLEVGDATRPGTAGRYELRVDGGAGSCRRDDAATADLGLDVSELGSCLLGGTSFRRLVRAGRVRELTPGAAAAADARFGVAPLPWTWTRF